MKRYKYIFVVLVYRNTNDLKSFFASLDLPDRKVIVVNSFFDEQSEEVFKEIAQGHGADFISVENRGYGAGNNAGCRFAMEHYSFEYLIISNADITIQRWDEKCLEDNRSMIIAPDIRTLSGKRQNPNIAYTPSTILERLEYKLYSGNHNRLIFAVHALSRFKKICFYLTRRLTKSRIYSPHGAFIILPEEILKKLYPLFNENMFLFNEERYLAKLAKKKGISVCYVPEIRIRHMEDGSISLLNVKLFELSRDSYMEYYNSVI